MKQRITMTILLVALLLCACGARAEAPQNTSDAAVSAEQQSAPFEEDAEEDGREVPEITSEDLVYFAATLVDGDIGYHYEAARRSDHAEATISVTAIPRADGYDARTITLVTDSAVLGRIQGVIAQAGLIGAYCNEGEKEEAESHRIFEEDNAPKDAMSFLFFIYDDELFAYHLQTDACAVSADDADRLRTLFFDILSEENVRFYGMDNVYSDEEYLDAFLACAPWDDYIAPTGETLKLSFGDDRVFSLAVDGETAAGNYKRRVQTAEGSRGTDTLTVTLTTWPVTWEQMMNGGSFIVEKLTVTKGDAPYTGIETVTIKKNGTAFSVFDPYYDEDNTITFTRNFTNYFEESAGEEAEETEDTAP